MSLATDDPFWAETAAFMRETMGSELTYVAPREFRDVLPTIFPYDWVFGIDPILQAAGVAIHKGLMHELPLPVLQFLNKEWKSVFANEVFVLFAPAHSSLPRLSSEHVGAFEVRLQSLEASITVAQDVRKERTALLVIASQAPANLERTLRSLSLLHLPVLVMDARGDGAHADDYRRICSDHRAQLENAGANSDIVDVVKAGVRRLLDDVEVGWVATFDDTMSVRPDFLKIMERFRDRDSFPVLSGFRDKDDQVVGSSFRDGFQLIAVLRQSAVHLYAHRSYWSHRFGLQRPTETKRPEKSWWHRAMRRSSDVVLISGLVTSQVGS